MQRKLKFKHSAETIAAIIASYEDGIPVVDIEKEYSLHVGEVSQIRRRLGIKNRIGVIRPSRGFKLTGEALNECICSYNSGVSITALARTYGLHDATIETAMKRAGVPPQRYSATGKIKVIDVEICVSLYKSGSSLVEIAALMDSSRDIVAKRLKDAGIILLRHDVKTPVEAAPIIKMYEAGNTIKTISEEIGISEWCIGRCLKESNIATRGPTHPSRVEASRRILTERLSMNGDIKTGKYEFILILLLQGKYGRAETQFQIEKNGHHYDAFAGGILWELDEPLHRRDKQLALDIRYDSTAAKNGYEIRRIWLDDIFEFGLSKWHNYCEAATK